MVRTWCFCHVAALVCLIFAPSCWAASNAGDLYCGDDDCYELLGLQRSSQPTEVDVKKVYRKLALQWHPDKNKARKAVEMFRKISRANEILSDEQLRHAYDYYLDHPNERYANYYRYYQAAYSPKTPLWAVFTGVLLFLSGLQWINASWRYSSVRNQIRYQASFQRRVNEVFDEEVAKYKGKLSKIEKQVLREQTEQQVFDSEVQLTGSGSRKPRVSDLVGWKVFVWAFGIFPWIVGSLRWTLLFRVLGREYGPEEKVYLTRYALGVGEDRWKHIEDEERSHLLNLELWREECLQNYMKEMAEKQAEAQSRFAQSAKYKKYTRWKKNH